MSYQAWKVPEKRSGRPTILPGVDDALSRLATLGSMHCTRKGTGRPTIRVDDTLSSLASLGSMHCVQKSASWATQRGPGKAFVMRAAKFSYVAGEKLAKCDENVAQAREDAQFVGKLAGISGDRTWSDLQALRVSFSIDATATPCLM